MMNHVSQTSFGTELTNNNHFRFSFKEIHCLCWHNERMLRCYVPFTYIRQINTSIAFKTAVVTRCAVEPDIDTTAAFVLICTKVNKASEEKQNHFKNKIIPALIPDEEKAFIWWASRSYL